MSDDDVVDDRTARVERLSAAVADLNANIDATLARGADVGQLADDIGNLRDYGRRNRVLIWITIMSVILDVGLSVGLFVSVTKANNAENDLCHATQRSWDTRTRVNDIITTPTVLSPEVERLFPADQTETLRLQIKQSNATRAAQRAQLVAANGPRPRC